MLADTEFGELIFLYVWKYLCTQERLRRLGVIKADILRTVVCFDPCLEPETIFGINKWGQSTSIGPSMVHFEIASVYLTMCRRLGRSERRHLVLLRQTYQPILPWTGSSALSKTSS